MSLVNTRTLPRWRSALMGLSLIFCTPWTIFAQTGDDAPLPSGVTIESDSGSLVVEWVVVAIVIGLALFAVCRSGRRN